jgi:competence protein ComEC
VADAPERATLSTRFTLAVDEIAHADSSVGVEGKIRATLQPSSWEATAESFPRVYEGDRIRLTSDVQTAPGQRNPGGFDYGAYLARRGVCCTTYVGQPAKVTRLAQTESVLTDVVVRVRRFVRWQIRRYVPSADGQAVLQALLLGDRSRVTDEQRQQFAKTGLMHLLAVSGLHVFLVGMVFYMLLRPLLMRLHLRWRTVEVGRAVLTVAVLCFYMLLTGARPSVVRAVVMSALFIGSVLFQRSARSLNTLGVAALVLLAVRPPALFDAGFQLSMAAVAAIVTLDPRFKDWVPDRWMQTSAGDWAVSTVTVSAAATIGTAPVLLYHFGWVSVAGLLLNVVGIPCTGLALSAAVAMVVAGGPWSVAGAAFGSTADLFVQGLLWTSRQGAMWLSWGGIRMADPDLWVLGALLCGSVALAQWPRPRLRWRCVACALFLLVGGTWADVIGPDAEPTLDLLFFDVGQGDAALVTTPEERRILVDTGPRSPYGGSAAASSILPFFRQWGIDRLDTVVITHPDEDHLGGLPALLRKVDVGRVVHSGQRVETDLFEESRQLLERMNVPHSAARRGDTLSIGGSVRGEILGPPKRPARQGIDSENGRSVVLRLAYGGVDVLLPGDIEGTAEHNLVRTYGSRLGSRVVKVPHHGSETSSTPPFVQATVDTTMKTTAIVSVGRENRFGMPEGEVLRRWGRHGAQIRSTARRGAVWLRSDGDRVWTVDWRK